MNTRKVRKETSRTSMLGLISKEQNNFVLYDLLQRKDFAGFCRLVQEGYSLDAFVLNCIADNGFDAELLSVLDLCKCYYNDIYDFLSLFLGQERAEQYFAEHNWFDLIKDKFSKDSLVKYKLWDIVLEQKHYDLIIRHRPDLLKLAKEHDDMGVLVFLRKGGYVNYLFDLYGESGLNVCPDGRKRLWNTKKWEYILSWGEKELLQISGFSSLDEVYLYILEQGGLKVLYEGKNSTRSFLLRQKKVEPFVRDKKWRLLYRYGYHHLIDLEDWWQKTQSEYEQNDIINCATELENWDFLETHAAENRYCLKQLFRNWRLIRAYRTWCLCSS